MNDAGDHRRRRLVLTALLGLDVLLFVVERQLAAFHALPWLAPDSAGYLESNVFRSPLYPLVLRATVHTPGAPGGPGIFDGLGLIQHIALLAAGTVLAYRFAVAYRRPALAVALAFGVLANPQAVSYCFTVLPESLFMSLLMVHLSFVLALSTGWNRTAAIGIGTTAALLAILKPAGYAAVAGLAIVALGWRRDWRTFHWLLAPAAALLLAVCAGNYFAHGIFATEAQGGYARAAYVGQLLDETTPSTYPAVTRRIAAQAAPIGAALASLPTLEIRHLIGANEYHVVESIVFREMTAEIERQQGLTVSGTGILPSDSAVVLELNRIGRALANTAIRARPLEYLRLIESSLYGLWWLPVIQRPDRLPSLQAEIDAQFAQHPELHPSPVAFRTVSWPAFAAIRLLLLAVILCAVAGVWLIWSSDPRRRVAGYVAILLHGYFLLVSLAQPGLPRYAIVAWPASMLLVFTMGAVVLSGSRFRTTGGGTPA